MTLYQKQLHELEERIFRFGVNVIKKVSPYQQNIVLQPLVSQLIRSSTSIGANYAEANNASSKADFRSKIYIAKKEIAETRYWLKMLGELISKTDLSTLQQEALELNLIFQKIVSSLQMKNGK